MKTLRKNLLLLAFAAGAMLLIGNNVFVFGQDTIRPEGDGGGFICYTSGTFRFGDSFRSCTTCAPVYNGKPSYWSQSTCLP